MTPGPIRGAGIMGQAIEITRHEHSAADLRRLAGKCGDAEVVRRLLALAAVLDGASRAEAARHAGMDRQTLRAWVHRHNAEGLAGLRSRQSPGRAPVLSKEQLQELKALVIDGPDPETHKVVRWRCCDLRAGVARRFRVEVHERTVGKWLRALRLTRLQPRAPAIRRGTSRHGSFLKTCRGPASAPPAVVETGVLAWIVEGSGR
jgi:transposase